jgi:hypothetical protein
MRRCKVWCNFRERRKDEVHRIYLAGTGVKIVSEAAHLYGFEVALARPWDTWMNKALGMRHTSLGGIMVLGKGKPG